MKRKLIMMMNIYIFIDINVLYAINIYVLIAKKLFQEMMKIVVLKEELKQLFLKGQNLV